MNKKNEIDMLNGPITGRLVAMALPIAAIMILQQMFNAADVAVVGHFAGSESLAAVGANTAIINMFITFFSGLSAGGNITIAKLIGLGERDKISKAVHTIVTVSLIGGVLTIIIGQIIARPLLVVTGAPAEIFDQALLYLRIYLFAIMFSIIYNFASAILRSKGDTKRPLYCLIASGIINVLLNLLLVIVFKLDVAGVAIATLISNIVCAGATLFLLVRESGEFHLSLKKLMLDPEPLKYTLRMGVPAGVQGMLFSISNIFIQAGINSFGPDCISGNTAAVNFEFISYFIVNAFGQASMTYMSQNFAAKQYDRCKRIFRTTLLVSMTICFAVSTVFYFGRSFWIGIFTNEAEVFRYAEIRLVMVVLFEPIIAFNEIPACGLRSMGYSLTPTLISITGSCIFRIIWINTVFKLYTTIEVLMSIYPISWVLITVGMVTAFLMMFRKKTRLIPLESAAK